MAESLTVNAGNKTDKYNTLLPQLRSLVEYETDLIANLANITAAIKETFGHFWIGFYLIKNETLVLGPFQGPLACTRIKFGKGVCGTAWATKESQLVPDVDLFPGHIACSSASRSEIVVPIITADKIYGVLDIDSDQLSSFDETDRHYLEILCREVIAPLFLSTE